MKSVIAIVVFFAAGFIAIGMCSNFSLNTIDSGMHNGRGPKMSFGTKLTRRPGSSSEPSYTAPPVADPGEVSANPFAK